MSSQKTYSVEERLKALFGLQTIDSKLDRLRSVRGELPLEVSDLEDEITGLSTRISNIESEISEYNEKIVANKERIREAQALHKKYSEQVTNVKNNREYDALNKEIELQGLEVLAAEKRINDAQKIIEGKEEIIGTVKNILEGRKLDLENKKSELDEIIAETEKEELGILGERKSTEETIEEKLIKAYNRIRSNVKNGIAVAPILRNSCGGCFAKMPPQLEADIRAYKKIVICEHCGRILVDSRLAGIEEIVPEEDDDKPKVRRRLGAVLGAKKED